MRHEVPAPARSQSRLLDQVRTVIGALHYSIRTEQAYVDWIRRLSMFMGSGFPADMGAPPRWRRFDPSRSKAGSASPTQNQTLNAMCSSTGRC